MVIGTFPAKKISGQDYFTNEFYKTCINDIQIITPSEKRKRRLSFTHFMRIR